MSEAILVIDNLSKSFGALRATDNVSLDLKPGEIHALIGPNGAGKSTLIKQICGELTPDSGTIHFVGQDIGRVSVAKRARMGLARTFQVSSIMPEFTVLQNVMLVVQGQEQKVFRFFEPALSQDKLRSDAEGFVERAGLSERVNDRASELSHGDRRKLEIALAFALLPKAFLLDEPMAGMGADGSARLTKILHELKHQAPILLVEHDMDAVFALADRISVLVYGRVIATGTVAEIRDNEDVRHAYLGEEEE